MVMYRIVDLVAGTEAMRTENVVWLLYLTGSICRPGSWS